MLINKDIQSQIDHRNITIDKVGVKNIRYPIIVEDKENTVQHTIADLNIYVELPREHRGTHMSRFIEVLNDFHQESLIANLPKFLQTIKKELHADAAYLSICFPYFIKKIAPVSHIASLLDYECNFEASLRNEYDFVIGVKVPITSLCPCSKEISDYGAHNQRSIVSLQVRYNGFIWLEELINYIESVASCEIYPLLKRIDEKYVTERAYNNPVFVEDIVRELAVILDNDTRIISYEIESENFESIHNHSAYAYIKK